MAYHGHARAFDAIMLHRVARDLRFALRQFAGRPSFTSTAVVVLALGLGANTAIFSVVNALLLRPLPFAHAERIFTLNERMHGKGGDEGTSLSPGNYADWRAQAASFDELSAHISGAANLSSETHEFEPERINVCYCSANFTALLGVVPMLGRALRPEEDKFGAPGVVLISYNLWRQRFGGASDVVGKSIKLDGDILQVAGVMPRGFHYPSDTIEAWAPLMTALSPKAQVRRDLHFLRTAGRLRAGVSAQQAKAELDGIIARIRQANPGVAMGDAALLTPLRQAIVGDVKNSLVILLGAVGCVLLIACVNVANLLLTRSSARARELAIRSAIGAGRGEILRQLLTESVLLSLAGGAAGLALAAFLTPVLMAHVPGPAAILTDGGFESTVFLFSFAIALAAGIGVGFYPAWQSSRTDIVAGLREGTRSATAGPWQTRFRGALLMTEVALSLVLLTGAGLLLHSFARLLQVKTGMRTDHALTMSFSLPNSYKTPEQRAAFYRQAPERLRAVPGVESAGISSCPPFSGSCNTLFFYREDRPFVPGHFLVANETRIDPDYLGSAGIPLLEGRNLTARDGIGFDLENPRPGSILISEATAREFYPGEDPIGKRIFFDFEVQRAKLQGVPLPKYEIVGVIGDVRTLLERTPQPMLYAPLLDGGYNNATILLHTRIEAQVAAGPALAEIHKLDPSLAVFDVLAIEDALGRAAADRRFLLMLFAAFAGLAVILTAVGLYGVLSYAVAQRRGEIGIRMALGASGSDVSRYILWEGMKPALAGLVLGLVAALSASRLLKTLLFGVEPLDPVTFALVPPLLLAISALACYLPAVRATRIDPMHALRGE